MAGLTAKQEAFVAEYMIDLNATQAAKRAGYSEKTANRIGAQNLSKVVIQEAVKAKMSERAEKTGLTAQWVIDRLRLISDTCIEPDAYGKIDASGANRATELIGKHLGMFTDKSEVKMAVSVEDYLKSLDSDEEEEADDD